jgi:HEAT repeat protein
MPATRSAFPTILHLAVCCALITGIAHAQTTQSGDDLDQRAQHEIGLMRIGFDGPVTPEQLAAASQPGRLIPFLEARFANSQDENLKASLAVSLVRLRDKNDTYWNFLVDRATPALECDAPDPSTPEYRAWAKAHNIAPHSAEERAPAGFAINLHPLAESGDPRGIPLLRKALQSPNAGIQFEAAEGLAEMHDKASIPLIIAAINRASPGHAQMSLANALRYFNDDARAKAVFEKYFPTPDPVERLKKDSDGPDDTTLASDIELAVDTHAMKAIPILKQMFAQRQDDFRKALPPDPSALSYQERYDFFASPAAIDELGIASGLVRLGVKDDKYWNYLAEQVTLMLDYAPPYLDPGRIGPDGKPPPDFAAWAKAHNINAEAAASDAMMFLFPGVIYLLAKTGDSRAIPLLRRALMSPNFIIRDFAAGGLAKFHDKDSIPLIIEACKTSTPDGAAVIAENLLYFDDPQAQKAAERYVSEPILKGFRENKNRAGGDPLQW